MNKLEPLLHIHISKALNRTITKCAKYQRELLQSQYNLPTKKLKNITKITRANTTNLKARLFNHEVSFSLNNFKYKASPTGINVKLNKQKTVFLKNAFLLKPKSGGQVIVSRASTAPKSIATYKSTIYSYKHHKSPKKYEIFYFKTSPFSTIAADSIDRLHSFAVTTFAIELDK